MYHFVWYLCRVAAAIYNRVVLHPLVQPNLIVLSPMWCTSKWPLSHRIFALTVSFFVLFFLVIDYFDRTKTISDKIVIFFLINWAREEVWPPDYVATNSNRKTNFLFLLLFFSLRFICISSFWECVCVLWILHFKLHKIYGMQHRHHTHTI